MSAEPKPLSPAQVRRVEEQWSTFTRTGHLELSMSTGRSVLLLIGAVFFAGFAALAIVVNVRAVMWGEETWHVLLNPMFWIFVAGSVLFGVLGIPAATVAIANRPSLVLTREGYFRVVGLPGRRRRHGFLPWTAIEAVTLTEIPSLRWPMPPTRLVTLVLTRRPSICTPLTSGRRIDGSDRWSPGSSAPGRSHSTMGTGTALGSRSSCSPACTDRPCAGSERIPAGQSGATAPAASAISR